MEESREHKEHVEKVRWVDYLPLVVILAFAAIAALGVSQRAIQVSWKIVGSSFMGMFFLQLSMFKLFDIKGFVQGFSLYDVVTQKFRAYGYFYPFIELLLGFLYLASWIFYVTNILTIIVMGVSAFGVIRSLLSKQKIACACIGTTIRVPLTVVSVIENLGMGLMAFFMLF